MHEVYKCLGEYESNISEMRSLVDQDLRISLISICRYFESNCNLYQRLATASYIRRDRSVHAVFSSWTLEIPNAWTWAIDIVAGGLIQTESNFPIILAS